MSRDRDPLNLKGMDAMVISNNRLSRRRFFGLAAAGGAAAWVWNALPGATPAWAQSLVNRQDGQQSPATAFARTPSGKGLWVVNERGDIATMGDASNFRPWISPPEKPSPFVALQATPSGEGLWALNQRGDILALGDAPSFACPPLFGGTLGQTVDAVVCNVEELTSNLLRRLP